MKSVLLLRPSLCLTESKDRIYLLLKYKSIVLQAELVKYLPTKGRKCYSMYRLCNKMKERRWAHAKCSSGKSTLNPSSVHQECSIHRRKIGFAYFSSCKAFVLSLLCAMYRFSFYPISTRGDIIISPPQKLVFSTPDFSTHYVRLRF